MIKLTFKVKIWNLFGVPDQLRGCKVLHSIVWVQLTQYFCVRFSIRDNASDLQTLRNCHSPLSLFEVFWHSRVEPKRCQDLQKTPFIYYYQLLVLNFLQPWLVLYIVQNSFVELDMSVILLRNLSSCFDPSRQRLQVDEYSWDLKVGNLIGYSFQTWIIR